MKILDVDVTAQGGILTLLGVIVAGLLGWRGTSKVSTDNAGEGHQRRFQNSIHKERDVLAVKLDAQATKVLQLQEALIASRDETARLRRRVREQSIAIQNLLEDLLQADPGRARETGRWVRDSTFAALDDQPAPPKPYLPRNQR